ncbi:MAG: 3-oxoacyl-[acyl-carrier-protein] synthase III C-terminal domain-containing protein [Lachnospiraceae bacterium]
MYSSYKNVEIKGLVSAVPKNKVSNLDYVGIFEEEEIRKQIKVTGICDRHCLYEGQTVVDLSCAAIDKILQELNWKGADIDVLLYVSAYGKQAEPSTALFLANHIGAKQECVSYDMNLGCSAFVVGISTAMALIQGKLLGTKALVVVADSTSIGGSNDDKTVSMLSGDCATVTALEVADSKEIKFAQYFDGSRYQYLYRWDLDHNLNMDGMSVFEFTITDVAESIKNYFDHYKVTVESCDYFVLHQAQKFIVSKVAQFSGLPKQKVLTSYNLFGNTGGPSLPCTLCANKEKFLDRSSLKVFFSGFGSGLSWGMFIADIKVNNIYPVLYVG